MMRHHLPIYWWLPVGVQRSITRISSQISFVCFMTSTQPFYAYLLEGGVAPNIQVC
jgi:hypothetical protein